MSTTQRVVRKQLAGAEDLLQGVGKVTQTRGGGTYDIHKLDIPIPMTDIAEMQASSAEFVRMYWSDTRYTDFRHNPKGTIGLPSTLGGTWEEVGDSLSFRSVAEMKSCNLQAGCKTTTSSYRNLSTSDTFGAANYLIMTLAQFGGTPDGYGDHLLDNGNVAKLIRNGCPNIAQYGAYANDATKDSTAAFNAAKAAAGLTEPVEIPFATYYVNITAWNKAIKGNGATLKRFDSSTEYAINFGSFTPYWQFKQVMELVIDGVDNSHEGAAIGAPSDASAGRWAFLGCSFINCSKGLRKYQGNIGNRFINCLFKSNYYGFFATDSSTGTAMHTGADYWEGNHIESHSVAGVYYKDATGGYGQHIFKANIFESNGGFGLVVRNTTTNGSIPFVDIALENNWFEANATLSTVVLDDLGSVAPKNRYFVGIRSMYIKGEYVNKSSFDASNCTLEDVRLDASYTGTRADVVISNLARLRAINATAYTFGGIKAYIESYKRIPNTGTIAQGGMASWAPNRTAVSAAGSGNLLNINSINVNSAINFSGSVGLSTTPITPGFLGAAVHQAVLPASSTHYAGSAVNSTSGKYFVATIMMRVIAGDATKLSASWSGASGSLGPIYIDTETPAAWKCCACVGISAGQTSPRASFVNSDTSTITIQVADQQVIEFATESEAIDFYNSRLFKQYV